MHSISDRDIHNTVGCEINDTIRLNEGATDGGNVINDGSVDQIMLDGATVEAPSLQNFTVTIQ
ncbi:MULTISPECIES: hypothetical protein [unclassified Endozoicomonas]|uniref:hypothetical protein n=1 Tax=unclassified Endozoicomonas TaxID=2644528 RepID=UPI003BB57CD0